MFYAFVSMFFAGFTSVIAKKGMTGISGKLGLIIRTLFVCSFVLVFAALCTHVGFGRRGPAQLTVYSRRSRTGYCVAQTDISRQ